MTDCLFCKIAGRELDAQVVAETDVVMAFRDISPAAPTHVLVIPKAHLANVNELAAGQEALLQDLFSTIASVADAEGLGSGYRVVSNVGQDGGQTVDHLHFHVLGGRSLGWPPG